MGTRHKRAGNTEQNSDAEALKRKLVFGVKMQGEPAERHYFDKDELYTLAKSCMKKGVADPIEIDENNKITILPGRRRRGKVERETYGLLVARGHLADAFRFGQDILSRTSRKKEAERWERELLRLLAAMGKADSLPGNYAEYPFGQRTALLCMIHIGQKQE